MVLAKLSEEAKSKGFRIENGLVVKYIVRYGELIRKRKNWKSSKRTYSRQFLKDYCEHCNSNKDLTIHHKIPLSLGGSKEKENCITLCKECHKEIHKSPKGKEQYSEYLLVIEKGLWGEMRIVDRI